MRTADFDYPLPEKLIAQTPAEPRDSSRLLVLDRATGAVTHRRRFSRLTEHLRSGDLLVFNDSRVSPARVYGRRSDTGGAVELLLLRRLEPGLWRCLGRPGRRLRPGTPLVLEGNGAALTAKVVEAQSGGIRVVEVEDNEALGRAGTTPLPPYIHQPLADPERYQTVYSRVLGSVAAPTAGLHFTPALLERLRAIEVELAFVTLHVGPGTFRPVQAEDPREHTLDAEYFELDAQAAGAVNRAKADGRRVVCVGTTAVRILETAAGQVMSRIQSPKTDPPVLEPATGWTGLMVLPGHRFLVADALVTNFHLPRSTLLMLVCAFTGREPVLRAYAEAVRRRYRFYSFGDAMLIL